MISVGAVIANPWLLDKARETGCRLLLPSGAIAGLDGIKSACAGHVDYVSMVSRKPPAALEGAPYVVEQAIELGALEGEQEIFSGTAREACRAFPNNLNVSAAVSVAGIGPDRTTVKHGRRPGFSAKLSRCGGSGRLRVASHSRGERAERESEDREIDRTVDYSDAAAVDRSGTDRDVARYDPPAERLGRFGRIRATGLGA